ncbi:MAG: SDR family NAD(P)-dependent oxidoreductase [Phycisphaerae bacterium]|nr:SDR family NAD(P)-dependent oxidoreductase [Phycisphaerae bacterium]
MRSGVAIVGMSCIYPDANSPGELWENVLAQRRAFRRIPPSRLRLEDYFSADRSISDAIYSTQAALIRDYEFDRLRFKVVGSTFRSADLAHWLALDVASSALADAGFADGVNLPREETAVILGNTLTGEFSRANVLRLRWPYVRRVFHAELLKRGWTNEECLDFLAQSEQSFKAPFPEPGEESLAGGLSNTIAGRICNHFDLKGGGYTVDGACAASLLAVTNACASLRDGDVSVALAGGVDISLDPFELVGFARTGALAPEQMRVYDARSAGFWPGEGCGFVVLMREEDAVAQGKRIYAVIRGWGVSSDGSGGITRPEVAGQKIALTRAYRRAGFGADRVGYFEGHGTGTAVGDATELRVLSEFRRESMKSAPSAAMNLLPAAIGSIKANIGHTKAAAGIAGLIKAAMAVHARTLPPATGCTRPHDELTAASAALRVLSRAEPWPEQTAVCAAVSAMGFGGINTHVVIDSPLQDAPRTISSRPGPAAQFRSQDAELFVFDAPDAVALGLKLERLSSLGAGLSLAEMVDAAAQLARESGDGMMRAAVVASTPTELADRLGLLIEGVQKIDTLQPADFESLRARGVHLARRRAQPRIGFLFPGQGSPSHVNGGAIRARFDEVDDLYRRAALATDVDGVATVVAQPAIIAASLAALRTLKSLGICAEAAVGHSLGELAALHWAGAFDEAALLDLARARGRAMGELGSPTGAMAGLRAAEDTVRNLIREAEERWPNAAAELVIAGLNSPRQTVVSGPAMVVDGLIEIASGHGIGATRLSVSHAFHSPLVAAAAPALRQHLDTMNLSPPEPGVYSTITGDSLPSAIDIRDLLCRQLTNPVRFIDAASRGLSKCDLLIEVGPGNVLAGLVRDILSVPAVCTDAGGESLTQFLNAVAAAYVLGATVQFEHLFADRLTRPIDLGAKPGFFVNPCELAPIPDGGDASWLELSARLIAERTEHRLVTGDSHANDFASQVSPLELVRRLVAERSELPAEAVSENHRLLNDLHLNSISVGQLVADAARLMGLPNPVSPTAFANATVAELGAALESWAADAPRQAPVTRPPRTATGVAPWIRPMTVRLRLAPLAPARRGPEVSTGWRVITEKDHPLKAAIENILARTAAGGGVVLCLPVHPNERFIPLMHEAARAAIADPGARFVVVQQGGGGAALAKTLHLEHPSIDVAVIDVPFDHPRAIEWVAAEASAVTGFVEASYDNDGIRRVPELQPLSLPSSSPAEDDSTGLPISSNDVLLITGGGKGIASECAVFLARRSGAKIALLGRSDPASDAELKSTLDRLHASKAQYAYYQADVCDAVSVARAIRAIEGSLGAVTAVLHAAGVNEPKLLTALEIVDFERTIRPKLTGLHNILKAVDSRQLRLLVSFGSIIGDAGMPGQADYAVANDWLALATSRVASAHPNCRCLTIDWSVWQSVGMGHRLGKIESLSQQGVTPIPTDDALSCLESLIRSAGPNDRVIVAGRFGSPPTLGTRHDPLPLLRFVERPVIDVPGIELIVDATVSDTTDPYVLEHALHGDPLFPAVLGLEAMAQVAASLAGSETPSHIESVALLRPVVVPVGHSVTVRLAALVRDAEAGTVDVILRSSENDFQIDHFRATFRFGAMSAAPAPLGVFVGNNGVGHIPLDRDAEIYGDMLFHEGRFRRVMGYRSLMARQCLAEISPAASDGWFATYLPDRMLLGDPAARDAAIHAIQSCIPHARLLPVGVDAIQRHAPVLTPARFIRAIERCRNGDTFTYDMQMLDDEGRVIESWIGLRLVVVEAIRRTAGWNPSLLGNYVERRSAEMLGGVLISVIIEHSPCSERTTRSDHAIGLAALSTEPIRRRPDGKPESVNGRHVSASHAGPVTLAVAADAPVGCDIEPIQQRNAADWKDLLGVDGLALARVVAGESGEDVNSSASRIWAAHESAIKAGLPAGSQFVLEARAPDGWIVLRCGDSLAATFVASLRDDARPMALAILSTASPSAAACPTHARAGDVP